MQVGEQDLSTLEPLTLLLQRLLDLHNQFGAVEHRICAVHDFRAGSFIIVIRQAGAEAGAAFNNDRVTMRGKFTRRRWYQADAIFVVLDLLRHADEHGPTPFPSRAPRLRNGAPRRPGRGMSRYSMVSTGLLRFL
jgi:hypothetical protein